MSDDLINGIDLRAFLSARVTRRSLLKGGAAIAAVSALGPLGSACGGGETSTGGETPAGGTPKAGGSLKIGTVGGSAKDTADPHRSAFEPDEALNWLMFEGLVEWTPDYTAQNVLAEEVIKNADATVWTVRVKPDVMWHDGKPLTADDVVFSFQRIVDPKNPTDGAAGLSGLKPENVVKIDDRTVEFRYDAPNVLFGTDALANRLIHIVPVGFDPKNPIGSGAFKLDDFRPGEEFTFSGFKDYHGGVPYLDGINVIEFQDPTARVNAFMSGTVDAITHVPPAQLKVIEAQSGLVPLNAKSGRWSPFCMRVDVKPFSDVRVRQAFRLIPDRNEILQNAFSGVGWLANDMYAPFDKAYPSDLPQREQDLDQAKSLLKQAGYDNDLTVEYVTSDSVGIGVVDQAQVFAEHAKGAGVKVKVKKVDSAVIYGDDYLSWPFSADYWGLRNYLQQASAGSTPDAPYNETHWDNEKWLALVREAERTADDAKRNELIREAYLIDYNEGGYIIPTFTNQLDAYSDKIGGMTLDDVMGLPLGRWRFSKVYVK